MPARHNPDSFYSDSFFSEEDTARFKKFFQFSKEKDDIPADQKEAFRKARGELSQTLSRLDPSTNSNCFYKPAANIKGPPKALIKAARSIFHTISSHLFMKKIIMPLITMIDVALFAHR